MADNNEWTSACMAILKKLQTHELAYPFLAPVDAVALGIPEYHKIITAPMDLGTIESKLDGGEYQDDRAFASDVRLVFNNCRTFNQPNSQIALDSEVLRKMFEKEFKKITKKRKRSDEDELDDIIDDRPMSRPEKRRLCEDICKLRGTRLQYVVNIIQKRYPISPESKEIELNVDELDAITLRDLERYVSREV